MINEDTTKCIQAIKNKKTQLSKLRLSCNFKKMVFSNIQQIKKDVWYTIYRQKQFIDKRKIATKIYETTNGNLCR